MTLGEKPITDVTKQDIIDLIKKIPNIKTNSTKKTNKAETARRVFALIRQIYIWALHNDLAKEDVPGKIDINSIILKPKENKLKAVVKPDEIRRIYSLIQEYEGDISTAMALRFLALTALRPGNIRNLEWQFIDMKNMIIEYPKEKMKNKRAFRLPLTKKLRSILENIRPFTEQKSKYVFCSSISYSKPLSENTLNCAHKRMGIVNHSAHGWRSAFSTICYENQRKHGFSFEVIESQLAHIVGSSVKMAYLRSDFLKERRELLRPLNILCK